AEFGLTPIGSDAGRADAAGAAIAPATTRDVVRRLMEDMRRSYERAGGGETGAFPILAAPSSPYLRAASVRDDTSSLRRIAETWWSTVFSETNRRSAICALRRPSATRASTSSSRGVRPAGLARVARRGPRGRPRSPRTRSLRAMMEAAAAGPHHATPPQHCGHCAG